MNEKVQSSVGCFERYSQGYILYISAALQEFQAASVPLGPLEVLHNARPLAIFQELLVNHDALFDNLNITAEDKADIPRLLVPVYFNIGLQIST